MKILVFTEALSPRIQYIFHHILTKMLGFEIVFTQDLNDLTAHSGPSINYSTLPHCDSVSITPHPLLTLKGVEEQSFAIFSWRGIPAFFPTCDAADVPFDLFAASFFLISRYEEYFEHKPDAHGRFRAQNSLLYKSGFIEIPVVDLWVKELGFIICQKFPFIDIKFNSYQFIPTIDIDNAYAYRYKGIVRSVLGTGKSVLALNIKDFYRRIAVYLRLMPDPYNTYRKLFRILSQHPQAIWFILGGKYGEFDKCIPLHKKPIRRLLKHIGNQFTIGIHPSYASEFSALQIRDEIDTLARVSGASIKASRQHFLRVKFPDTYRMLNDLGLSHDFSLGYQNVIGFRAGTCTPFTFFDVLDNKELPLTLVPFQVMDRALIDGLKLDPQDAIAKTLEIAQKVKDLNGTFVLAWHNESLSGIIEWKGWENVLREIVEGAKG